MRVWIPKQRTQVNSFLEIKISETAKAKVRPGNIQRSNKILKVTTRGYTEKDSNIAETK